MNTPRELRRKIAELTRLLIRNTLAKLNSFNGLIGAKIQLWKRVRERVKEQHPEAKWTYSLQMKEWESHPLQKYIKLIELKIPLPDLPPDMEKLTPDEINEYLIWRSDHHQGVKEWKRYGRLKVLPTGVTPKGTKAYIPKTKK